MPTINYNELSYITNITDNYNKIGFCQISSGVVLTHLNSLSMSKASGLDSISARLIHKCADIISGP